MKFKKFTALALASVMSLSLAACGTSSNENNSDNTKTGSSPIGNLVVGSGDMNGIFNPLFYSTVYDKYAFDPVFDTVMSLDDNNQLVPNVGDISYEEILDENGKTVQVEYTITLQQGIKFHDGKEVTIDDLIFTYYVFSDPSYDGISTFTTLNIVGLDEFMNNADVLEISGIQKIDDYTCTVLVNGVNIIGDRLLADTYIIPRHYYGFADDGTEMKKGDMSIPKSKNDAPMGSGPYIFEGFENNIVKYTANLDYFKGTPSTASLRIQVVSEDHKVNSIIQNEVDIDEPQAQKETIELLEANNIPYNLTDNNGYGFIGINSDRISDINVRKGLMHLMNRGPAIESYYGNLAEVIERPLTTTLAEYPENATEYYGYDKEKALEYFTLAGYSKNSNGKLVDASDTQLKIEVGVSGISSHPSSGILTQMKTDMEELGAELIISDLDSNILFDRVSTGDLDMFVMAWGNSTHADLTQIYHSSSADGSGSNHFRLRNEEIDALLEEVVITLDLEKRKELIAKELDLIMESAVVMPVYQRKNLTIFNPNTLNIDTVYQSNSPYHTFRDEIHTIEMR